MTIERARRASDGEVSLPRPRSWGLLAVVLALLAVADLVAPHMAGRGLLVGLVGATFGHDGVRLGSAALLGAAAVWALRRCLFSVMAGRPGAVEIFPFGVHGPLQEPEIVDRVTATFRRELGALSLTAPTSVPGDNRPQNFVQAFRTAAGSATSLLDALPGVLAWLQVTTGYEVSADLEERSRAPGYGMTLTVRAQPAGPVQRTTVWGDDWDDTARRAADVVGAHIVTRTALCRRGPWSGWRGRRLDPQLLRAYQDAQACVRDRRYEEALSHYYRALELDPLNTPIRIEVCQIREKLGLYLGALVGYADVILTESWNVDRRLRRRIAESFYDRGIRPHRRDHRARGRCRRSSREALMIARYRFVCALVNGDRVVDEWTRTTEPPGINDIRAREREEYRRRMASWLRLRYPDFAAASGDAALPPTCDELLTTPSRSRAETLSRLFRYVATVEARGLARDYAWWRGRRRPGMPVSETSLAVLRVWAPMHLLLVTGGDPLATPDGDRLCRRIGSGWPLQNLDPLEAQLRRALRWAPRSRRRWQDHYTVATVFAVLLLRPPRTTERRVHDAADVAARAVRYLELAITTSSPGSLAGHEQWVAVEDQDLNGLRGTPQYVELLERIFPGAERWEPRPYDLLTFLTSTHLAVLMRDFAAVVANAHAVDRPRSWIEDVDALRVLRAFGADHADWRTRLMLIKEAHRIGSVAPDQSRIRVAFPRFSDDPGLRSRRVRRTNGPDTAGSGEVDRYYERLTDLRHSSWTMLVELSGDLLRAVAEAPDGPPPQRYVSATGDMWDSLRGLFDAALRGDDEEVGARRAQAWRCARTRLDLLCSATRTWDGAAPPTSRDPVPTT